MKYLLLILLVFGLSGCGDNMTLHKQDNAAAVEICQKNDGYDFYKLEKRFLRSIPHTMIVSCNDGAIFVLGFEKIMTQYTDNKGQTYDRWENVTNYKWKVKK